MFAAVVGLGAYRVAFQEPKATLGLQDRMIGTTKMWVLPNPSGLNAHFTPKKFGEVFGELRRAVEANLSPSPGTPGEGRGGGHL